MPLEGETERKLKDSPETDEGNHQGGVSSKVAVLRRSIFIDRRLR